MDRDNAHGAIDAVRALFEAHAGDLHAYASRRVGRDLADDVVADTFRQAIESWDRFDPELGTAHGWLFGITTNLLRRHWRTERRRLAALQRSATAAEAESIDPGVEVAVRQDASHRVAQVLDAVADLGPEDRDLLVLVSWERLPHAEVADALAIPVGTVRSRLHRIRRQLDAATTGNDSRGDRT